MVEMRAVETTTGRVRGLPARDGVTVFRGIPYAAPPLGELRFRAPVQAAPWAGVRDAFEFGPSAMQNNGMPEQSEDCLTLNVWTPAADAGRRPIFVYLHGGGYGGGGTRGRTQDGSRLAREGDVVVVSITHRLSTLGYLYLGGLRDSASDTANVGLLDIVHGLQWVRDNISGFGGDPERVTVWGESGGGWKISNLLAMPAAAGLFHGAIIQSGSFPHALTPEEADDRARRLLFDLEIPLDRLDLLAAVPAERLLAPELPIEDGAGRLRNDGTWQWRHRNAPVVDGEVLPREPFAPDSPAISAGVPLMIGVTRDEFSVAEDPLIFPRQSDPVEKAVLAGLPRGRAEEAIAFYHADVGGLPGRSAIAEFVADRLFFYPAVLQAERRFMLGGAPVYHYLYSWGWPSHDGRAIHTGDMAFVFGNLTPDDVPEHSDAEHLARTMRKTWAAFAHSGGDPNHEGLPEWDPYDLEHRATFVFDAHPRLESDPRGARRRLVESEAQP
jgi:para-nitrobenzyl esterase